jgi:hypothetical protein
MPPQMRFPRPWTIRDGERSIHVVDNTIAESSELQTLNLGKLKLLKIPLRNIWVQIQIHPLLLSSDGGPIASDELKLFRSTYSVLNCFHEQLRHLKR